MNLQDHYNHPIKGEEEKNSDYFEEDITSLPNAGKLIGIVERLISFALILSGQYSAVGLIIAAKSILRFQNIKQSEYVLVGTLLSFGIAIFLAMAVSQI